MYTSGQSPSAKNQAFLNTCAVVLLVVLASALADQLVPFFPMESGIASWRFERFGTFLGNVPLLVVELVLAVVLATMAGSRMLVRVIAAFALVIGVLLIPCVLMFALDFVEVRRIVQVENRQRFDLAAMKTGLFGGLFAVPIILAGWKGLQATAFDKSAPREKGAGLVVGN